MDFNLTEQQEMFQKSVRRFAEAELTPLVDIMDKENQYPFEIRPKLVEMNLLAIPFDPKYGGAGADHVCLVLAMEEVAKVLAPIAISMQVGNVTCDRFNKLGTEEQKQKYMIPICENKKVVCFAFTEPDTGSNPKMLKTRAQWTGDGYVINGAKRFITHAGARIRNGACRRPCSARTLFVPENLMAMKSRWLPSTREWTWLDTTS